MKIVRKICYTISFGFLIFSLFSCQKNDENIPVKQEETSDIEEAQEELQQEDIYEEMNLNFPNIQDEIAIYCPKTIRGSQMESFIIKTKDALLVVDGGHEEDASHLKKLLLNLGGIVDVWLITHYHSDHIGALSKLIDENIISNEIIVKSIIMNYPERSDVESYEPGGLGEFDLFDAVKNKVSNLIEVCQKNEVYEYKDYKIEVLRIYNPSIKTNFGNNSSNVYRITISNIRIILLGDLGIEGGNELINDSSINLECDILQMAHHGQSGVSKEVYESIKPKVCLWPTPIWLWENNSGEGYNTGPWRTLEVREWMEELGAVNIRCNDETDKVVYFN